MSSKNKPPVKIKFGTDGWRAIMDKEFTMPNVERLAQAFSDYVLGDARARGSRKTPGVAVAYDYRENSENFAATFAAILASNGIRTVLSLTAVPTPALSFTVVRLKLDAGIMITASHNPAVYNGVKIKTALGSSADASITKKVETLLDQAPVRNNADAGKRIQREDMMAAFVENMKRYLDMSSFNTKPFNILVDSMHGTGGRLIESLLKSSALKVTTIRSERDIRFGGVNPEPIPKNFRQAAGLMKKEAYDVGIVTDGDADRIGLIRPGGDFVTAGTALSLLMLHLAEDLNRHGIVVTTISNTSFIRRVAKGLNLEVRETPVGFKYICEIMKKENVLIGGEESGGLAFQDYMLERDGVMSGLLIIQMMEKRQKSFEAILKEAEDRFGKFYYARKDIHYPGELKSKLLDKLKAHDSPKLEGIQVVDKKTYDGVKFVLVDDAWLLLRLSGTEPLLRIYAESAVPDEPERLIRWGESFASRIK